MMHKPNHDNDRDDDHANDNGADRAIAPAPAGGALTSLAALGAALSNVDTTSVVGRSGMPLLVFKREGDGTWSFGQRRTVVEDGSRWAANPTTFKRGYICFDGNKVLGEHLVSVSQEMPNPAELPDKGGPWQEQWAVNLKCLDGADAGVEVVFKSATDGGLRAVVALIDMVHDRLNAGQHDNKVSPIVHLEKDSYQHVEFGKVWFLCPPSSIGCR